VAASCVSLTFGLAAADGCSRSATPPAATGSVIRPGGAIVASVRSEPRTFNRLVCSDRTCELIGFLTQARLVHINRVTQEVEPWLAESWTRSDDGLRYTLKLRPNVRFSDGQPFTSADVAFTLAAIYDPKTRTPWVDSLQVHGKNLGVATPDAQTIVLTFPSSYGPGLRMLDNLPIYPRHKLQAALDAGTMRDAWNATSPPADTVGLGPFMLTEYVRGQRLVFVRNPHYWRKDANGVALPYLDQITVEYVPEQDAEVVRLRSGETDMSVTELRPADYAPLKRDADAGKIKFTDLGLSYDADFLLINLKPNAFGADPRAAWLQKEELRRAISMAVDRDAFVNTVFFGAGVPVFQPITPANRKWFASDVPRPPYDPAGAKRLLASIGLTDRNGDGVLEDANNKPARFTLLTQKGRSERERATVVIRDELRKLGLLVDTVYLEYGEVMTRLLSSQFEALYFGFTFSDTDPASNADMWLSSSASHFWNPSQAKPATEWEARIDELMARQIASQDEAERRRVFAEVQKIFVEHQPLVYFGAPRIFVATSARVVHATPAPITPQLLWAADTIAVVH